MMTSTILDLHASCRLWGQPLAPGMGLQEALAASQGAGAHCITDWAGTAVFGIATVMSPASSAAAVLEKQLRDQGETDDIAHIVVHQSRSRMGSTELTYSAVPVKTWRRYQQASAEHVQLALLHDWVSVLLQWAKQQNLATGALLVVHPEALDVLVLEKGQVLALDRLRIFQDEADDWTRTGQRVVAMLRALDFADAALDSTLAVTLVVTQGCEAALPQCIDGLAPYPIATVWAENPEQLRASLDNLPSLPIKAMDWGQLAQSQPLRLAQNRPADKAAAWADRWVPHLGVAAFALSCIIAGTAAFMHYQNQIGLAAVSGESKKSNPVWQTLSTEVQAATQLGGQQKPLQDWVQLRIDSRKVPDMAHVLAQIRNALPAGMVIDEVGLVVEKGAHLVTVIGYASVIENALSSESAFAQAMQAEGFTLQKRDLLVRDGLPKFKLSMTWSAT